ncbi:MAG: chemotaxis protein CheA [Bacteriovoracaceae bacterium]|nr:chemotaxis protein CheA [Bacteriovoracaceae bacterium]
MTDDELFFKEMRESFLEDATELLEQTEQSYLELERDAENPEVLNRIFRCVHTIKGTAAAVNFESLAKFSHKLENLLVKLKNGEMAPGQEIVGLLLDCNDSLKGYIETLKTNNEATVDTTDLERRIEDALDVRLEAEGVRQTAEIEVMVDHYNMLLENDRTEEITKVDVVSEDIEEQKIEQVGKVEKVDSVEKIEKVEKSDEFVRLPLKKIDSLLDYLGEQVILQTALEFARKDINANSKLVDKTIVQLSKITYDLQQTAIALRMFSLKSLFNKAQRIVRDVTVSLGREVNFVKVGEATELDKTIIDELSGAVTHLVRNSVDHGIESNEERERVGKPTVGTVKLHAFHQGGFFYLEISDDGRGLDTEKIREKAIKNGVIGENQDLSESEIHDLIFQSGFTTKEKATEISGRGVGMDVVKDTVDKLRGSIFVESKFGEGTTFTVKLPLTLAIFNGMIVRVGGEKFVFPNSEVKEICHVNLSDSRQINASETVIKVKDEVMPLVGLNRVFKLHKKKMDESNGKGLFLIVNRNNKDYAMQIDEIIGQQKIVLKKLGQENKNLSGVAGGTILGDGKVALILDIHNIIEQFTA